MIFHRHVISRSCVVCSVICVSTPVEGAAERREGSISPDVAKSKDVYILIHNANVTWVTIISNVITVIVAS